MYTYCTYVDVGSLYLIVYMHMLCYFLEKRGISCQQITSYSQEIWLLNSAKCCLKITLNWLDKQCAVFHGIIRSHENDKLEQKSIVKEPSD